MPAFAQISADQADWSANLLRVGSQLGPASEYIDFQAMMNPVFGAKLRTWPREALLPNFVTCYLVLTFGMLETARSLGADPLPTCSVTFRAFMKAEMELARLQNLVFTDVTMRRIRDHHPELHRFIEQAMSLAPSDQRLIQRCTALLYRTFEIQHYLDQETI